MFSYKKHTFQIEKNVLTFKSQFGSDKCYFSFGTNKSRGVGIVILNPHITVDKYFLDLDGRLVYVDIYLLNVQYRIINVYAPNDESERCIFFDELYPICITQRTNILGGDFNCVSILNKIK